MNLQGGITEWDKSWEKEGQTLLVTYQLNDGKIVDFFIPTDDPSGVTTNKEKLLAIGNASSGEGRYRVEFVKSFGQEGSYTGVKIIPN